MEQLNFSVKPMVNGFDLKQFLENKRNIQYHSVFLIITKKQLVYGYTNDKGSGYHLASLCNALREIYDMPLFQSINEQVLLEEKIENSFITGRFINDIQIGTYLSFYLQEIKKISYEEFRLFEYFYNEYNDIIDFYSNKYKTPLVFASLPNGKSIKDEYGNKVDLLSMDNLDYIYKYLKSIISPKRELMEDKNIIGISLDEIKRR